MVFTLLLASVVFIVLIMALREIYLFRKMRDATQVRRLTLRLSMAAMLLFLLVSLFLGVCVFRLVEPDGVVPIWLAYWGCITLLTGAILLLVIADFRLYGEDSLRDSRQYWEEFARTIAAQRDNTPKE
ncbi:MAG TPA: hypothetical protein VGL77_10885 [Armatimonadota bacterium]